MIYTHTQIHSSDSLVPAPDEYSYLFAYLLYLVLFPQPDSRQLKALLLYHSTLFYVFLCGFLLLASNFNFLSSTLSLKSCVLSLSPTISLFSCLTSTSNTSSVSLTLFSPGSYYAPNLRLHTIMLVYQLGLPRCTTQCMECSGSCVNSITYVFLVCLFPYH